MTGPTLGFGAALETALRADNRRGIYVLGANPAILVSLLRIDCVAGVILSSRDQILADRHPGRIGWIDWTRMEVQLPEQPAELAIGLFGPPEIGLTVARALWARGVRRVGYFDPERSVILARLLSSVMTRRIARIGLSFPQRIRRLFRGQRGDCDADQAITPANKEIAWAEAFDRLKPLFNAPIFPRTEFAADRVLIVTGSLGAGGSERQVVYTVLGLQPHVGHLSLLCQNSGPGADFFLQRIQEAGIKVETLDSEAIFDSPVRALGIAKHLLEVIHHDDVLVSQILDFAAYFAVTRPGVVHTWLDWTNITAGIAAMAVGVPRIVLSGRSLSPKHFSFHQPFMRPGYRAMLESERVVLLNNSVAGGHDYARWLGIDPQRIRVLLNAIDPREVRRPSQAMVAEFRASLGTPESARVLGGLFRFSSEKRPKLWLDIAATVARSRPDIRFLLVGDGPERAAVAQYAERLGLNDKLFLPGQTADPGLALATMDCFLLTSRVEGLPNVLLEAQFAGVPVVTSDVGGAKETLDMGGLAGVAVPGENPDRYAQAILAVLESETRAKERRDALPRLVLERFGLDRMIRDTLKVYGTINDTQ